MPAALPHSLRSFWLIFAQATTIALGIVWALASVRTLQAPPVTTERSVTASSSGIPSAAQPTASVPLGSFRAAVARSAPAVVSISTSKTLIAPADLRNPLALLFDLQNLLQAQRVTGLGSGVLIGSDGTILTNHHVVEGSEEIRVSFASGKVALARLIGSDADTDLAVLRLQGNNPEASQASIALGDSDALAVGDIVLAIGNPFGVGQTVTQGIVSALGRRQMDISAYERFIQTDAAINPGNSGGALVDTQGRLVGINTAIYSKSGATTGVSFAIPINLAAQIMTQLIRDGRIQRGWIGIEAQDLTEEWAALAGLSAQERAQGGAMISGVVRQSPAFKAGVRPGDVALQLDAEKIHGAAEFINALAQKKPGQQATLTLLRGGKTLTLNVAIQSRPQPLRGG